MPSLFERADANLRHATSIWAASSGGSIERRDGLLIARSPVRIRAFNQTLILDPAVSADVLRDAIAGYPEGKCRVRFSAEHKAIGTAICEAAGFELQGSIPTLVLSKDLSPADPLTDLTIERVTDARGLLDHSAVVAEGFEWDAENAAAVFTPALLDRADFAAYVGYADGKPVTTAQLIEHEGSAGLYYIATTEAARRRGYGEAITRHAIADGLARGCDITTLQASRMGRPIYERLGFELVGEHIGYIPPKSG